MNKEEIIKELCKLNSEDLVEISNCLDRYKMFKNRTKKDTLFIRYIALRGFNTIRQFYNCFNITRCDTSIAKAVICETPNIKAYLEIKKFLNIDDDIFIDYITANFIKDDNNG